ncbi:ATP-binding protein [Paraburkholderia sp. D1E]|uniref:ATP-binding protein n=1 Tax=Paraburkholderia sp. D1E TaxID=3461398 RepID=UPI00404650DD
MQFRAQAPFQTDYGEAEKSLVDAALTVRHQLRCNSDTAVDRPTALKKIVTTGAYVKYIAQRKRVSQRGKTIMMTIGEVEILPDQRRVLVAKKPIKLGSRAFDLLELLASERGQLVSKEEIMRRVWPGTVVEENNMYVQISAIRKMLDASSSLLITLSGRGYRLEQEPLRASSTKAIIDVNHPVVRSNLPLTRSTLYGCDEAIEEVLEASDGAALVSLVGPGGIGKTRLVIEATRRLADCFADGVRFVELAQVYESQFVARAVLDVLDSEGAGDYPSHERIVASLRGKHKLIVLGNCEQVVQAVADVVAAILGALPTCKVIVTSREPLRITGECVYRVRSLEVPRQEQGDIDAMDKSAVQLFFGRAQSIAPRFTPNGDTIALVVCNKRQPRIV